MVIYFIQNAKGNKVKKIFLSKKQFRNSKLFFSQAKLQDNRNHERGFIELEMLAWIFVLTTILGGFFQIHKSYYNAHIKLQKDFTNDWNNIR